jgi:hypothetical protein
MCLSMCDKKFHFLKLQRILATVSLYYNWYYWVPGPCPASDGQTDLFAYPGEKVRRYELSWFISNT